MVELMALKKQKIQQLFVQRFQHPMNSNQPTLQPHQCEPIDGCFFYSTSHSTYFFFYQIPLVCVVNCMEPEFKLER